MATIRFQKSHPPIEVAPGENLMQALLRAGLPVASSCRGDGVCGKCRVQILDGGKNLSSENDRENFLRERFELLAHERISCQTSILGDITIDTTYW